MKLNSYLECVKSYGNDWDKEDDIKRQKILKSFPYSYIIEGAYPEYETASKWCLKEFEAKEAKWTDLWYGKTGYDYGFWEFFFKDKQDAESFKKAITGFYAETAAGKWKTDGYGKHINL